MTFNEIKETVKKTIAGNLYADDVNALFSLNPCLDWYDRGFIIENLGKAKTYIGTDYSDRLVFNIAYILENRH